LAGSSRRPSCGWAEYTSRLTTTRTVACFSLFAVAAVFTVVLAWAQPPAAPPTTPLGIFDDHADAGTVLHAGSAEFDAGTKTYTVSGSGENMWATADAFHFVWKKVSGDVSLAADIRFPGEGGDPHRKAVLMVRQSLDADSAYADAALHGNGLTSLQARDARSAATHEVQSNLTAPRRLRIEKRGRYVYMSVAGAGEALHFSGGSMRVALAEPYYIGIAVCAHNKDRVETAVFSNVELETVPTAGKRQLYSTLETITVASTDARAAHVAAGRIGSANWSRDGKSLVFNSQGRMQRVPVDGGKPETLDTGFAVHCNDGHGLSPDGNWLAISDESRSRHRSAIYIVPAAGGAPRLVTKEPPAYFHGWSPDARTLVFTAGRKGKLDIYSIASGGPTGRKATQLTSAGANDAPEYSPDGKYIYFSSDRTGTMQIWRMQPDGSGQEPVTADEFGNGFPHISPDGRQMAFLSYENGGAALAGNHDVMLRVMALGTNMGTNMGTRTIRLLARLVGGPGTFDAASWSPDSRRLAFVSYSE